MTYDHLDHFILHVTRDNATANPEDIPTCPRFLQPGCSICYNPSVAAVELSQSLSDGCEHLRES